MKGNWVAKNSIWEVIVDERLRDPHVAKVLWPWRLKETTATDHQRTRWASTWTRLILKSPRHWVPGTTVDTGEPVIDPEKPTAPRVNCRTEKAFRGFNVKLRIKMREWRMTFYWSN